jgi:hypothetical protein
MGSSGMLRRMTFVRADVSEGLDEGGAKFLRNVRSYKSHKA